MGEKDTARMYCAVSLSMKTGDSDAVKWKGFFLLADASMSKDKRVLNRFLFPETSVSTKRNVSQSCFSDWYSISATIFSGDRAQYVYSSFKTQNLHLFHGHDRDPHIGIDTFRGADMNCWNALK